MCLLSKGFKLYNNFVINPTAIMCIGVSIPPQKQPPSFLPSPPLKLANCPRPLFRQSPLYIGFSWILPHSKIRIFQLTPKILTFFILNTILKVTKFLGKISQFEFLVMTGKNVFSYKPFLSFNISDFNIFFMLQLQPPVRTLKKVTHSFPATYL